MTKESITALQSIDCNCNDCFYLIRSVERFQVSLDLHYKWQIELFTKKRDRVLFKAHDWLLKGETEKANMLFDEGLAMSFMFDKSECRVSFGYCKHFNKGVSFISGTLQIDTQNCFTHRKSLIP